MKPPKDFDCVQMKWKIQEQLAKEFAGVPEEEAQRRLNERVRADPILGPFLKRVQDVSRARLRPGRVTKPPLVCPPFIPRMGVQRETYN